MAQVTGASEKGTQGMRTDASDIWLVSYAEDDDRELSTTEIAAELGRGALTATTMVWRDGMPDWQHLVNVPALRKGILAARARRYAAAEAAKAERKGRNEADVPGMDPVLPQAARTPVKPSSAERLDQASLGVEEARRERQKWEEERTRSELAVARLQVQLAAAAEESVSYKALSRELAQKKEEYERKLKKEEEAKQEEALRQETQDAIEQELTATQHQRAETERWRSEARALVESLHIAWAAPILDSDTQKARRNLIATAGIVVIASLMNMFPSKLTFSGLEFAKIEPGGWPLVVGLLLGYAALSFCLKSWHSFEAWIDAFRRSERALLAFSGKLPRHVQQDPVLASYTQYMRRPLFRVVAADLVLPVVIGVVAAVVFFGR